ncbi:MAG: exodeoxyribonuclease VII large subunit [Oscillospiraceae bacterium]
MKESISVSALNRYVKVLLETDEVLCQVWVEGEISGLVLHQKSGHMYFTLKDNEAAVKCVMFKGFASRLRFVPEDGMKIVARCKVSLYERDGAFQLYIEDLIPLGAGTVAQELKKLTEKLEREGLFAAERKKPLVQFPKKIAVITSSSGAAFQDIINVMGRRYPFVGIVLYPVNVQGILAVKSIVEAIAQINDDDTVDEVIIARGGGSKEDLWIFNDESLVRAACSLNKPLISAVGHEIDITLIDYVSDRRAPTPSAAAEIAVPDAAGMFNYALNLFESIKQSVSGRLTEERDSINTLKMSFKHLTDNPFVKQRDILARQVSLCDALSPLNVILRGYSIAMLGIKSINSVNQVSIGDIIDLKMADGYLKCDVREIIGENIK